MYTAVASANVSEPVVVIVMPPEVVAGIQVASRQYVRLNELQDAVGKHRGYEYSRSANPTRSALETCVASLEGARHGLGFASGLAAEDAILRTLDPGDHVVLPDDAYGGTFRLVARVHERYGIAWTACDLRDPSALEAAWQPETRMVWIETPTNPTLACVDIAAVVAFAHPRQARVVVDNTFATPYLQQPLALGADVSVHSSTKYLGGHSDVVGGFIAVNDAELADDLRFLQNAMGAVPSPFDCYLVLRGVKTLAVRMREHCANAQAIVAMLRAHEAVAEVLYPDQSEVAARQMRDFGGMVSFLAAFEEEAIALVGRTKLFQLAESLGGVESLIEVPARMTHASTATAPFAAPPNLVRLSVGIESAADLIADLEHALVPAAVRT
jgi:cystathionine gamma-synthase